MPRPKCIPQSLGRLPSAAFDYAEDGRDRGADEIGVADSGEGDERGAVGELAGQVGGDAEGQSGFADAAGAGERQQPDILSTKQVSDRPDFFFPADERGERDRQTRLWGARVGGRLSSPRRPSRQRRTLGVSQSECRGQGADRRGIGMAALASLQGADRVGRKPRLPRLLLLREPHSLAGTPQAHAKGITRRVVREPLRSVHCPPRQ